jgi:hypothetical protein
MDRKSGRRRIAFAVAACALSAASGATQPRPEMQRIPQFENERAVSWKSVIPPHSESTLHRHDRYRSVVALAGGDLKTVTAAGDATVTHYETGKSYWQAPMPPGAMHKDVNDTDKTIELVVVEIK